MMGVHVLHAFFAHHETSQYATAHWENNHSLMRLTFLVLSCQRSAQCAHALSGDAADRVAGG
jgi:hypothetical protein